MARANTATLDGLLVGYGARDTINTQGATVHTKGNQRRELQVVVDSSNIGEFATSTAVASTRHFGLPEGAYLRGARYEVTEAFSDLTSIDVGLKESDGTEIDADGLSDGTVLADIDAVDDVIVADGALVGTVLGKTAYLSVDVTGTDPTAGTMHVYVEYDMPVVDQNAPAVITGEV